MEFILFGISVIAIIALIATGYVEAPPDTSAASCIPGSRAEQQI